jgi:hypothetical protein
MQTATITHPERSVPDMANHVKQTARLSAIDDALS